MGMPSVFSQVANKVAPPPVLSGPRTSRRHDVSDVATAKRWIAAARSCGLVVAPWDGGVLTYGKDLDGPNSFGAASMRLSKHAADRAVKKCQRGLVFQVLCTEYGVEPDDPRFHEKVNAVLRANRETTS